MLLTITLSWNSFILSRSYCVFLVNFLLACAQYKHLFLHATNDLLMYLLNVYQKQLLKVIDAMFERKVSLLMHSLVYTSRIHLLATLFFDGF